MVKDTLACFKIKGRSADGKAMVADVQIACRVIDAQTRAPLSSVRIIAAPLNAENQALLAGDRAPIASKLSTTTTNANGDAVFHAPAHMYIVTIYGESAGHITFHGVFTSLRTNLGEIQLLVPTPEERATLTRINAFRARPGGTARYAVRPQLVFDENLMESARFWAAQEKAAGKIGHTCAALGNPIGCIEFRDFFHGLPGAPADWSPGQDAAFDTVATWEDPESGFEDEGRLCSTPYDWQHCENANHETGHFTNLMMAQLWVGLGKQPSSGSGSYFAMNVI